MTQPAETAPSQGGGLTSKLGPLPVWGWVALATAGGIGFILWRRSKANAAAATTTTGTVNVQGPDSATVQNLQDQLAVVESQIRDTQAMPLTPGPAGPVGPAGGIGPPGTPGPATPVPSPAQATSRTTISSGESVAPMLAFFGMTQQQFEQLNPGIQNSYYHKPGTGALAFTLPADRIVTVAGSKGF